MFQTFEALTSLDINFTDPNSPWLDKCAVCGRIRLWHSRVQTHDFEVHPPVAGLEVVRAAGTGVTRP